MSGSLFVVCSFVNFPFYHHKSAFKKQTIAHNGGEERKGINKTRKFSCQAKNMIDLNLLRCYFQKFMQNE